MKHSKIVEQMEALITADRERFPRGERPQRWSARAREAERLPWFLRFVSCAEPKGEKEWEQREKDVYGFYVNHVKGPPLLRHKRPHWTQEVFHRIRAIWGELSSEGSFSVPLEWGARRFRVQEGRLVPAYVTHDPTSAFLLAFVEQLSALDDLGKIQRCHCGTLFYKIKRQKYCSKECTQEAHPSKERTRKSRQLKAQWEKKKGNLSKLLADIDAIERKQKPQRPRTERQILEETEKAWEAADRAFTTAYPHRKGLGCKEGKALLANASEQVKRLRKKVRGY